MTVKAIQYSSNDFVKEHDEVYFELLRLARITECADDITIDRKAAITVLNQLPVFEKVHKRIIPLLNDKAYKLAIFDELSAESQKILTTVTQQGIVTELARKQQLTKITTTLSEHNIPLILLKGAAFADVLYSARAPRTSNDLDILIHKKHWHKAVSVIKGIMVYKKKSGEVFDDLCEISFKPKSNIGSALDLHMSLSYPLLFNINECTVWEDSIPHPEYDSSNIRILSAEQALVHQAIHAFVDMNFCKYNLVDSHEVICQLKPDLKKVISVAKEWGVYTSLYILLDNSAKIMGSNLNQTLLQNNKPNFLLLFCARKLLQTPFSQPINNAKPILYRVNQMLSQFIFTGSIVRPLALQWLYIKSKLTKSIKWI